MRDALATKQFESSFTRTGIASRCRNRVKCKLRDTASSSRYSRARFRRAREAPPPQLRIPPRSVGDASVSDPSRSLRTIARRRPSAPISSIRRARLSRLLLKAGKVFTARPARRGTDPIVRKRARDRSLFRARKIARPLARRAEGRGDGARNERPSAPLRRRRTEIARARQRERDGGPPSSPLPPLFPPSPASLVAPRSTIEISSAVRSLNSTKRRFTFRLRRLRISVPLSAAG